MHDDRKVLLLFVPFFGAGVLLHLWKPIELLGNRWVASALGIALVGAAVVLAFWAGGAGSAVRLQSAAALGYLGAAFIVDSVWPIALLLPALAFIIRWRAVTVQTGRRQPPS